MFEMANNYTDCNTVQRMSLVVLRDIKHHKISNQEKKIHSTAILEHICYDMDNLYKIITLYMIRKYAKI